MNGDDTSINSNNSDGHSVISISSGSVSIASSYDSSDFAVFDQDPLPTKATPAASYTTNSSSDESDLDDVPIKVRIDGLRKMAITKRARDCMRAQVEKLTLAKKNS